MDILSLRSRPHRASGLTLVEMMSTLAISGVLLTAGLPAVRHMLASNAMTSELNGLVAHLHLARSTAVKRGRRAVLCPSSNGVACLSVPQWHQGYILFVDRNANREHEQGEPLIRFHPAGAGQILITSSAGRRRISYRPDGASPGTNLTISFCDLNGTASPKAVIISNTGRARVSASRADGRPLNCG